MFLANLTLGQFLMLLGGAFALVVALYLLDRSRRRHTVATLRFWVAAQRAPEKRRRRIQQPLSLVLQLAGIALLLLALAQLRLGSRGPAARDHVLILDTGAWMAARSGRGTLMDEARALARAYVRALPASDRVMVVRADALATPATSFETNRRVVEQAIGESRPGATALHLAQAFAFAAQAQKLRGATGGEVVFVGSARILEDEAGAPLAPPSNLRVLPVAANVENCGLRKIGLRRSAAEPALWEIFVSVRNYGAAPRKVLLSVRFGGAPAGTRELSLAPASDQSARFELRTRAAGWLNVSLAGGDAFPADDRAVLELPPLGLLRVTVCSERPELLRPVLLANPWVRAEFRNPQQCDPAATPGVVILDRIRAAPPSGSHTIWIEPPAEASPAALRATLRNVTLTRWRSGHPLAAGIRTQDLRLDETAVYQAAAGDVAVAETEGGPVIVAREGKFKTVVLGFHPGRSAMRYELATPLLFANIMRWMAPEVFRRWEAHAGSAGTLNVELEAGAQPADLRVEADDGSPVPYSLQEGSVRFFAAASGTVRILTGASELVYSLNLPQVAESRWQPPAAVRRGLPASAATGTPYLESWPWLALAGGLVLLIEWMLFGRWRMAATATAPRPGGARSRLGRMAALLSRERQRAAGARP